MIWTNLEGEMFTLTLPALALSLIVLLPISARALPNDELSGRQLAQAADPNIGTGEGEVRKIDKSTKKVTVRHGPIAGLDMEPMSMVLQVKEATMLDKLAVGDKIKFTVRRGGGAMTLESFEALK
jgi:Cu(I)/Ag(I) efflux system protein CusF